MEQNRRLIDADEAVRKIKGSVDDNLWGGDYWIAASETAIDCVNTCHTVDAVEVVRCKECQYYTPEKKRCDHPQLDYDIECYDHWVEMEPNDFCSCGERKICNDKKRISCPVGRQSVRQ